MVSVARSAPPVHLDLGGQWRLSADGDSDSIAATVPGTVHTDLLAAGKIKDPFFRDNASGLGWIGDRTWVYTRTFDATDDLLSHTHVILRCEGLDTLATVRINGRTIAQTDNMFRTWEFDVRQALRPGENRLTIRFAPIKPYVDAFVAAAKDSGPNTATKGIANVRKALYGNGWDFCPALPTCGIYKSIELVAYDVTRIRSVLIDTQVEPGQAATVIVRPNLADGTPASVRLRTTVTFKGKTVAEATDDPTSDSHELRLTISNPQLWWPAGMGDRPMYDVRIAAMDEHGTVLDTQTRRVGLRKIELLPKSDTLPLRLRINNRDIFARGASWIPSDMFLNRVTPATLHRLLADAAAVGMNTIRTWGGGYYEEDAFYDACDELGLLVWHDFKFACNAYPGRNKAFTANVDREVIDQVTRLSPHPSLAVWCGNNEVTALVERFAVITRADYDVFFHDLIGGRLKELLPGANYVGGSPEEGDEHNWWVWHIGADFEKYRESHGWMTEFGFQSFPVPATVNAFTTPADRDSVLSPVMKAHQHNGNQRGNEMILDQIARYFRPAKDFESMLWLSQINQAYGLTMGIEHWRSDWPRSSGAMVWQLDDCWPGTTWSTIDYFGRWKAAHYALRAAYAPVLVTGAYDAKSFELPLTICSDRVQPFDADVRWTMTETTGTKAASGQATVAVPAGTTAIAGPIIDLKNPVAKVGAQRLIVWVEVAEGGHAVARKTFLLVRPKNLELQKPTISATIEPASDGFDVTLVTDRPALWTWINLPIDPDAKYSDNFVDIAPGQPVRLHVQTSKRISLDDMRTHMTVRSVYDTSDDPEKADIGSLAPSHPLSKALTP